MIRVYSDGGSRGNPGPAALGCVIVDPSGNIIKNFKKYLGRATNNQAEYKGLIKAMQEAQEHDEHAEFYLDSQLVVNQLNGRYKVRNPKLKNLYRRVRELEKNYSRVKYKHVPRTNEYIQEADSLVNLVLDEKTK